MPHLRITNRNPTQLINRLHTRVLRVASAPTRAFTRRTTIKDSGAKRYIFKWVETTTGTHVPIRLIVCKQCNTPTHLFYHNRCPKCYKQVDLYGRATLYASVLTDIAEHLEDPRDIERLLIEVNGTFIRGGWFMEMYYDDESKELVRKILEFNDASYST